MKGMDETSAVQQAIQKELDQAQSARASGKEGMARVCARRAAGLAIGAYLHRQRLPDPGPSAMDRLRYLNTLPHLPPEIYPLIRHLTRRVDTNYALPPEIDLIADAQALAGLLLENGEG